jgi:16S rRNA (guanine527-N7)-methyltransferase
VPTPDWFSQLLRSELAPRIYLSDTQISQLYQHYDLLLRWNQRMNLTTVSPGPEMVIRHYCESLFFGAHLPAAVGTGSLLDLGTGAGFPGVPTAVLKPEWRVTLVESSQRKAVFLRESTRHLTNISVLAARMESISLRADWIVARAVDPNEVLQNACDAGQNIGLMLGENDFSLLRNDPCIAWADPIRLPWGDRRLCVYGTRST